MNYSKVRGLSACASIIKACGPLDALFHRSQAQGRLFFPPSGCQVESALTASARHGQFLRVCSVPPNNAVTCQALSPSKCPCTPFVVKQHPMQLTLACRSPHCQRTHATCSDAGTSPHPQRSSLLPSMVLKRRSKSSACDTGCDAHLTRHHRQLRRWRSIGYSC
jgi:hypothetical protein